MHWYHDSPVPKVKLRAGFYEIQINSQQNKLQTEFVSIIYINIIIILIA